MGAFEIIENPENTSPMGSFKPKADQTKFRSVFACVNGSRENGWLSEHEVKTGITTQDGRAKLVFDEYKDPATKQVHEFATGRNMRVREFVVPIEEAEKKEAYEGRLSSVRAAGHLAETKKGNDVASLVMGGKQEATVLTVPAA